MSMFSKFMDENAPRATVRDGMLVLSLTNAISPVVWRLDIGNIKASALEIRENDDLTYDLVLKNQKSDLNVIASFENRSEALRALKSVMRAIEETPLTHFKSPGMPSNGDNVNKVRGQDKSSNSQAQGYEAPPSPVTGSRGRPVLAGVIGACIVLFLIFLVTSLGTGPARLESSAPGGAGNASASGEPITADEFLKGRPE